MVQQSQTKLDEEIVSEKEFSLGKVFLRAIGWTLVFVSLFFIITLVGVGLWGYQKFQIFADSSGQTPREIFHIWKDAWQHASTQNPGTILVLGSDHVANRGTDPVLTDTMMLVRLNSSEAKISLYSLPRDLWLPTYKAKINSLYYYGQQRNPSNPTQLVSEAFLTDLGVKIDQTVVVSLDELATLIDEIGGLPITIQEGFVDPQFPRTDVDIKTERDPAKLYQRVEFTAGEQILNGECVLQFVRSRHAQGDQGTDIARAQRQQLVISSLINALKNPSFYTHDISRAGKVYRFYITYFSQLFPPDVLIGQAKLLWPNRNNLSIKSGTPSIFPENPQGVITHPPISAQYQQQWVYIVRDIHLFQLEVAEHLGASAQ